MTGSIRFSTFPRTEPPPAFVHDIVSAFRRWEPAISTQAARKGLKSNDVLATLTPALIELGFEVEAGRSRVKRPVFFGEDGASALQYEIDSFHPGWRCGLEVEAGRAWLGNAVYRDLVQALVMVDLENLILAVPLGYRRKSLGRDVVSKDYVNTCAVADALFGHSRIRMPYRLIVIGY
ncbi:hypothetical protein [Sphingosinicella sp. CPCC 101087]|uniref:hypothetical protein n=1 Tax=Sphingosinicella sp. CPCC 101087 TaxID=2497754 RepID=UPI00101C2FD8|nr:hypothetical protein [Sphingosinicella sp. CPCC 101087]